jgi:hyaluronan synthase
MWGNQTKTLDRSLNRSFSGYRVSTIDWSRFSRLFFNISSLVSAAALLFLVILIKAKTTGTFLSEPYFFAYTFLVTVFAVSRIFAAMFYKRSFSLLLADSKELQASKGETYEPTVAFIIPCKNEENDIANTINKCFQTDYPIDKAEVIVVNDGSTDGTMAVLKELKKTYPNLRVFDWPKNQGKRWAMAAGFRVSKSEIIIQLDSDSYVDAATFRDLIEPFQNSKVAAVCANGIPQNADQNVITKMQTAYYCMSFQILKAAESTFDTVFCCSGCCSAYRKSSVMPILYSWLGEKFLGLPVTWGDDRALTSWLIKNGEKTIYNGQALAYTIVPSTWKQLFKQQLRWKKSWIINAFFTSRFIWKKRPFMAFLYYFPLIFISILAPIMTFRALILSPLSNGALPIYHIIGVTLITGIVVIYYRFIDRKNKYWPYLFLWSLLNLFVLSFLIVWAALRLQDRGWGTR